MKPALSKEFDIRAAVVTGLLADGLQRNQIRLEIPLDTASSNGRGDIVVLHSDRLLCVELKSGKDKYCEKALSLQCEAYHRAFDAVAIVADYAHYRAIRHPEEVSPQGWTRYAYTSDNWQVPHATYYHNSRIIGDKHITSEPKAVESLIAHLRNWTESRHTSVHEMGRLLWASEIKQRFGFKTKGDFITHARENMCLAELRPHVIMALQTRPDNEWEKSFWNRYAKELAEKNS